MRVIISYHILTLDTDANKINTIIRQNPNNKNLTKIIDDYNSKFSLITYPDKTIFGISEDIKELINQYISELTFKSFYFVYESNTVYKVKNSKIYQLNDFDRYINKDIMLQSFNAAFNEYCSRGLINKYDFENNLNEDFICINISILEKNKPIAVTDPGEIFERNIINKECWNFVTRLRQVQNEIDFDEEIEDDEDDDYRIDI